MHANQPGADRADAAPDDAQRRFDELLAHLPAGVVMHDAGGRVVGALLYALEEPRERGLEAPPPPALPERR